MLPQFPCSFTIDIEAVSQMHLSSDFSLFVSISCKYCISLGETTWTLLAHLGIMVSINHSVVTKITKQDTGGVGQMCGKWHVPTVVNKCNVV